MITTFEHSLSALVDAGREMARRTMASYGIGVLLERKWYLA